jgi:hypothetical protein
VPEAYKAFLATLYGSVKKHYDQGLKDFDMKEKVRADLAPYTLWANFDGQLGRLISLAYLEVEADSF